MKINLAISGGKMGGLVMHQNRAWEILLRVKMGRANPQTLYLSFITKLRNN